MTRREETQNLHANPSNLAPHEDLVEMTEAFEGPYIVNTGALHI
jgi:hypothetical protein